MSVKKMLLLASMAVAAVAFAAPAAASGHFTHNGEPIGEEAITTELAGVLSFSAGGIGSYQCAAHPVASIGTESGTIEDLGITTNDCKGTGAFSHCKLKTHGLTSPKPTLMPTGGEKLDIDLKNFKLTKVFETGDPGTGETTSGTACSIAGLPLELAFENMTLKPDNHTEISELTASGNGVLSIEPSTPIVELATGGTFEVVEGQEGTIGIST